MHEPLQPAPHCTAHFAPSPRFRGGQRAQRGFELRLRSDERFEKAPHLPFVAKLVNLFARLKFLRLLHRVNLCRGQLVASVGRPNVAIPRSVDFWGAETNRSCFFLPTGEYRRSLRHFSTSTKSTLLRTARNSTLCKFVNDFAEFFEIFNIFKYSF